MSLALARPLEMAGLARNLDEFAASLVLPTHPEFAMTQALSSPPPLTPEERLSITRHIMALCGDWGLGPSDILALLALPATVKTRHVARFLDQEPFPDDATVNRRLGYLTRIEQALGTYFPRNPEMRSLWVKRGNRRFGSRPPLAVMIEDGEGGLVAVLAHLDCTFAWDETGSKTEYAERKVTATEALAS